MILQKIYIAGPYSAEFRIRVHNNVMAAIDAGLAILELGHYPFIPHLTHYVDLRAQEKGIWIEWSKYMEIDSVWLRECDALFYLGPSKGADIERNLAKRLGKTIYEDIDDIPKAEDL